MLEHTWRFTLPAAYALLPARMASPAASAMLLAIGLQESRFRFRRQQGGGPARGFYQFERGGGVAGVLTHRSTAVHVTSALEALRFSEAVDNAAACHALIEWNDTLATVFARLLLWTLPAKLPARDDPHGAWGQYLTAWRPGRPHPASWPSFYSEAWALVETQEE